MAIAVKKKASKKKPSPVQESGRAVYLYGISQPVRKPASVQAEAVDGAAKIEPLRVEGLDCWISRVDRQEFAEHLAENMENLEWLATVGVRHQRAVAALAGEIEILPARFGTVFLTEQSLVEHVAGQKKSIQSVFKKIAGSDEWGVKVFRSAHSERPAMVEASSGTDYLKRKAQTLTLRAKDDDPVLRSFLEALSRSSVDTAPGGKASTGQPNLVWHGSFLVRRTSQKKFADLLQKFTSESSSVYQVECSGPWPPYSFVVQNG